MTLPEPIISFDIHPTRIGYAVVSQNGPIDWGVTRLRRPLESAKYLRRLVGQLCRLWQPAVAIIGTSRRNRGRYVKAIRRALSSQGVRLLQDQPTARRTGPSKHALACDLARQFPELNRLLPRKRRLWEPEDDRMHIFSTLGLALLFSPRTAAKPKSKCKPQSKTGAGGEICRDGKPANGADAARQVVKGVPHLRRCSNATGA